VVLAVAGSRTDVAADPSEASRPRPTIPGLVLRGAVYAALAYFVLIFLSRNEDIAGRATDAVVFAIIGLSLHILIGYTGQLSLGHQGFQGVGAFTAAYVSFEKGVPFALAIVIAMLVGAAFALLLGFIALRITGLYLALITLVFGITLKDSLFELESITGGGAGAQAVRPEALQSNVRYYFLCLAILAVVLYLDWRLTGTKAGRALLALRENERVASAFGINVTAFKLFAFVLSGALAGLAGALFVYRFGATSSGDYEFNDALTFVLMVVVGGLGSRVGVVLGSVLFSALGLRYLLEYGPIEHFLSNLFAERSQFIPDAIGAFLLLTTLIFNPGGIAQQLKPITRWLGGKKFTLHGDKESGPGVVEGSSARA